MTYSVASRATLTIRENRHASKWWRVCLVDVEVSDLSVLRGVHSVGELAKLVLMFGPHSAESLGQVALKDVDDLRELPQRRSVPMCARLRRGSLLPFLLIRRRIGGRVLR